MRAREKIIGLLMNSSRTVTLADTVYGVTDIDKTLSSFPIKPNLAANPPEATLSRSLVDKLRIQEDRT